MWSGPDRDKRVLVRSEEFTGAGEAATRYVELEVEHRVDGIEIVLVGSGLSRSEAGTFETLVDRVSADRRPGAQQHSARRDCVAPWVVMA